MQEKGFRGCTAYDCFGAGQRVAQQFYAGRDWRTHPELSSSMFETFAVLRQLHELLWYLREARRWPRAAQLHTQLDEALERTETLAERIDRAPDAAGNDAAGNGVAGNGVAGHRAAVAPLLRAASTLVRGANAPDRSGADLAGSNLHDTDLRDTDFRNACLIGADLRGTTLTRADMLGADLRGADVRGADLHETLFLTQPQLAAARGNGATRIPSTLDPPAHWPAATS